MSPTREALDALKRAAEKKDRDDKRRDECAAEVLLLLIQARQLMTGWILQFDQTEMDKLFNPIYDKLDV